MNANYFDFETNTKRSSKPKFDANGDDDAGPWLMDFSTGKLRAKYNDTLQVNAGKELCIPITVKDKNGRVSSINSPTKSFDFKNDMIQIFLK